MTRLSPALAMLLVGCFAYQKPAPPTPGDTTPVNASIGRTWDAVIDVFALRNTPIRTIERVSGIIATDRLSVGPEGRRWADCGSNNGRRLRPDYAIYNVLVRGDSATATVKATVRWVGLIEKTGPVECSTTHVWEQDFESEVKDRAEERGVATARPEGYPAYDAPATVPAADAVPQAPTEPAAEPAPEAHTAPPPGDRSSSSAPTRALMGSDSAPPAATEPGDLRSNADLLTNEGFRRAVGDMQRKGFLLGYREMEPAVLAVDLSASALTGPTLEYQLTRLFLAYGATLTGGSNTTLVLLANGQPVGRYTRQGINWDAGAGRP